MSLSEERGETSSKEGASALLSLSKSVGRRLTFDDDDDSETQQTEGVSFEEMKQNLVELNVLPNTIGFFTNFIMNADKTILKMANDKSQYKDYAGWFSNPLYNITNTAKDRVAVVNLSSATMRKKGQNAFATDLSFGT